MLIYACCRNLNSTHALHGGGAAPAGAGALAGVGAPGVRVLRVHAFMQTGRHSWARRTLHVWLKKGRLFFREARSMMRSHALEAKALHWGIQNARQLSCMSAIAGEPMDSSTSMMQAATGTTFFLSAAPLAEAIDQAGLVADAAGVPRERQRSAVWISWCSFWDSNASRRCVFVGNNRLISCKSNVRLA